MTSFDKTGEDFLGRLNEALQVGERGFSEGNAAPQRPLVLVVGPPRSGTTVTMQWLSTLGFGVPTNLLARMYRAPHLGGLIQNLLTDPSYNYRNELDVWSGEEYQSEAGKTNGLLAPHEFFYFWRQYIPLDVARPLRDDEFARADIQGFASGLARVRGHEKVPTGGQVAVPSGGQEKSPLFVVS